MKRANKDLFSTRTDRVLGAVSLIGLILFAIPLLNESIYNRFFGRESKRGQAPVIGQISYLNRDVRLRGWDSLSWEQATSSESIELGDRLFTGSDSQSQVVLKDGSKLDCGANSLV